MDRLGALRFGEWAAALPGDTRGTLMRRTWECKPSRYAPPRFRRALAPLARAQARLESGGKVGSTVAEILANIGAMEFAIAHATGVVRTDQNWIGGNNYNPCGASFVGPLPQEVPRLLEDLCAVINDDILPPVIQAGAW